MCPPGCAETLRSHRGGQQIQLIAHQLSFGLQVQATVVGLLAAVAAVILGAISKGSVELSQAAVLCASSVTTAFIAALSLGESFWFLTSNMVQKICPICPAGSAAICVLSGMGMRCVWSISPMPIAFNSSAPCPRFSSPGIYLLGSWPPQQQCYLIGTKPQYVYINMYW